MNYQKFYPYPIIFCLFILSIQALAQKPDISTFSPTSGSVGSTVTIAGNNFSTVAASNVVYFGDVKAVVNAATSTTLNVIVPPGASYKPISVTTNGLTTYSLFPFTVTFPSDGSEFTSKSFSLSADSSWGYGYTKVSAIDLDGDGDTDPILVCTYANFFSILKNNSTIGSISLSYSASSKYTTGISPVNLASGDLDGDGKQDIVIVNSGDNTLSIFKNNSTTDTIKLLSKVDLITGTSPAIAVVSDIDNDGKPDIICTNSSSNTISIFKNTTTASVLSFASKIDYSVGKSPNGLLTLDIDGDGNQEVAVANVNDFTISIFKNNSTAGSINLGNRTDIDLGSVFMFSTADFDGDGKLDLATSSNQGAFAIHRNISSLNNYAFADAQHFRLGFGTPTIMAISDIDGDGKPDIAFNHSNYFTLSVVKNLSKPGSINFSSNTDFFSQMPLSILLADLDNDARSDVISVGSGPRAMSILRNLVSKPFISSVTPISGGTGGVITIKGNNFLTTSQVSFGGTPATSVMIQSTSTISAVIDTGSSGEVAVTTLYGVAKYTDFKFSKVPTISSFYPNKGGSGTTITINGTNFNFATAVNIGSVPATSFTIISPTSIIATVGSINDGNYDISVTNTSGTAKIGSFYTGVTINSFYPTSGPVGTIVTINGTNFKSEVSENIVYFGSVRATVLSAYATSLSVLVPPGTNYQPITVTSNNFTAYSQQPFVVTFNGTDTGFSTSSFYERVDSLAGKFPMYVSISDLNNDGKSDVVTSNFAAGSLSVSKNTGGNGITSFQYKVDYTTPKPLVWSSANGDLDGDGKTDIIAVTKDNGVSLDRFFSVFKNVSTIDSIILTGTEFPIGTMNDNPRYSAIVDIDEDGRSDVIFLSFSGMAILRNTSTPGSISFAPKVDLMANISIESQIAIADVDGDGKSDIVVVGSSNNVFIFRNTSKPGQLSFAQQVRIPTGFSPTSVSLGDLDNDGKPDMVVLNGGNNSISFYKNLSVGGIISFDSRNSYQLGIIPDNLALGDLDGDGRLDVALVTTRDKFVYVLKNTSSVSAISFADKVAYDAPYTPGHVFMADMNNDGKSDIVVNNASDGNNFSVFVNKSLNDGFPSALISALGPTEICEGGSVVLKTSSINDASYQWYNNGNIIATSTDSVITVNAAGIYTVKVSVSGIISNSAPISVSVKLNPPASLLTLSGPGNICQGMTTLIHSSNQIGIQWYKDNEAINGNTDSIYRVDAAGKYKVVTSSNGCLSPFSNEIIISSSSRPVPSITASTTSFCLRDSIQLTANNINSYTYQWYINDEQVPGATSVVFVTKSGGNFSVSETDGNGCSAKSSTITISSKFLSAPLISASTTSFCSGDSIQLTANNINGYTYQWYLNEQQVPGATAKVFATKNGGNFSVSATDNNGCSAKSPTITITQYPSPLKPTITQMGNDLKSSAQNGNQWYKGGIAISGATFQTFSPNLIGNYSVQVSQNGCISSMSDVYSLIITGVDVIDNTYFIKLNPNPVQSEMILEYKLSEIFQLNIDLLDLSGRIIKQWKNQKSGSKLYLTDNANTMYLARIYSANGKIRTTLKLIKF
jgi:hypothetical protein